MLCHGEKGGGGTYVGAIFPPATYPFSLFQGLSQKVSAIGYAGLDNNVQVPILNILDLPQSKIINLSTTLSTLTSGINLIKSEIGHVNGIALLENNGKLNTTQILSLAIGTVTTVQTITDRNNLTNVEMGYILLVIHD